MKKALAISSLSLALILTACGSKDNQDKQPQKPINTTPKIEESAPSPTESNDQTDGISREDVRKLMTQSDYISRVKLTQLGDGQTELTILDNYKGSLSNIEFPEPKNLSTNKEYLIFYKDDSNGNVVATSNEAIIEVATKNDTVLDYVERTYAKQGQNDDQENRKNTTKSDSKRDTSTSTRTSSSDQESSTKKKSTSSEKSTSRDDKSTTSKDN